jgi:hypothetical protein
LVFFCYTVFQILNLLYHFFQTFLGPLGRVLGCCWGLWCVCVVWPGVVHTGCPWATNI